MRSWPEVRDRLNAFVEEMAALLQLWHDRRAYQIVNNYVEKRVQNFLRRRSRHSTMGTHWFTTVPSQLLLGHPT
jgi:hypothetical protein